MHKLLDYPSPEVSINLRPDFNLNCVGGYYACDECGYPCYPFEVINDDNSGYDVCEHCTSGDMVKVRS